MIIPAPMKTQNDRIREKYTQYPVWLFYWWRFASTYQHNLKEFRKTIANEDEAETFGRKSSSKPMVEVGRMIDKYKTW